LLLYAILLLQSVPQESVRR